jgi:uncharacterized NAD(P)/FAD-binding protein YdhS
MMQPLHITIIGGGFCGIVTAINLLQNNHCPVQISIVNKGYPLARGVAYAPANSSLLLNVPNGRMGAFPNDPGHFLTWLKQQPAYQEQGAALVGDFSPREVYGIYLGQLWREALVNKSDSSTVAVYDDLAYKIIADEERYHVYLKEHPVLSTDVVVLATGNALPRLPSGIPESFSRTPFYCGDPWCKQGIEGLKEDGDVLIIGNGLTMADTVVSLVASGFKNTMYTVSPHGFNLNSFTEDKPPYEGLNMDELLAGDLSLSALVETLNKHRKAAERLGQSTYTIVDKLRPYVPKIWRSFSAREKEQFLTWFRHLWGSIRHRLPNQTHRFISKLYAQQRLITYKGKVKHLEKHADLVAVTLNSNGETKCIHVQRIINCTGPEGDPALSSNELLRNLEKSGMICADEAGIAVKADPATFSVIAADGIVKPNLFVIGSGLKGVLWESTAVPELRIQAKKLADMLAGKAYIRNSVLQEAGR